MKVLLITSLITQIFCLPHSSIHIYTYFHYSYYPIWAKHILFCVSVSVSWLCTQAELTYRVCIIQFKAAEDLVNISGMEKSIAPHHHLETL